MGVTACAVVTVVGLVAACDSGSSEPGASSAAPASGAPENPNLQAGVPLPSDAVTDAVGKLDGLASSLLTETGIPGLAVAVVHGGQTVYAKGFGVADVTTGAKVDANTVFPLASMSKPVGATVIGAAITDRRAADPALTWDMPVTEGLPAFALADPSVTRAVTVADMYAHRSGLPDHAGDKIEDLGYPQATILQRLRYFPLQPFRITYDYTNFGVTAGAEAIARRTRTDWAQLSEELIYRPLGMLRTSSRFADFETRDDRVVGHVRVDGKWVKTPAQRQPDAQSPAGGVSSSVNDLTSWMKMLLAQGKSNGREIIAPEVLLPAITPQIVSMPSASPDARSGYYGYGFNVSTTEAGRTQFSHSGAFSMGAATNFLVLPSADVAIVVLSNAAPIGAVETLSAEFADLVQFGEIRHDWRTLYAGAFAEMSEPSGSLVGKPRPANPAPAPSTSQITGTYQNPLYGPADVRVAGERVQLLMGPGGSVVRELTHWDGNTYTFTLRDENAEVGSVSKVTFVGGRMVIEYYAEEGVDDGVFTRSGG
ncbi:serine hydrolase [Gordonia sp. ABSL1-1]|uniref:serine hydrolase n=1 Tax=Gordonia sp. ABSL1-1 TaxID=3053923 RepID=UPI002573A3CE|nr:serine hydrolase [Gordonia sp. ABSL1-1]MDL9936947.1 serine hydrolase [Gordonia sp. ABSL1-1]